MIARTRLVGTRGSRPSLPSEFVFERPDRGGAGADFEKRSLPVVGIFSEFGCVSEARTWTEVASIYSEPMTDVWRCVQSSFGGCLGADA